MKDVFYEETSICANVKSEKIKYYFLFVLSIISYALAVLMFILMFYFPLVSGNLLISILIYLVFVAMFIASGIFIGKLKNKFCLDYDYTFVNGSVRIRKVIKNVKSRRVAEFETNAIIEIGKTDGENFDKISGLDDVSTVVATSNYDEEQSFFYVFINDENGRTLFILDCTEKFIKNVLSFTGVSVLEKGLR